MTGDVDKSDLGGGSTNDPGSCSYLDTFNNHTAFSDTPASFVSPFLTGVLSSLGRSTGEVTGDVGMDDFGGGSTDGLGSCGSLSTLCDTKVDQKERLPHWPQHLSN